MILSATVPMSAPRGSRVAARGRAVRGRGTSTLRGTRGRPGGQPTPTNTGSIPRHKSPPVDDVLRNGSSKLLQPPKQQTIRKTSHTAQHASSSPPPDAPRQNAGALPHRGMDAIYQKVCSAYPATDPQGCLVTSSVPFPTTASEKSRPRKEARN